MKPTETNVDHQIYISYKYIVVLCSKITQIALHLFDAKPEHLFQSETSIGQYISVEKQAVLLYSPRILKYDYRNRLATDLALILTARIHLAYATRTRTWISVYVLLCGIGSL